jgi:hypothetical protein
MPSQRGDSGDSGVIVLKTLADEEYSCTMTSRRRLFSNRLFHAGSLCFLLCGCAPPTLVIEPRILHQDVRFTPEQFSGQSVTLFPVFTTQGFETSASLGDSVQGVLIQAIRQDLALNSRQAFESRYLLAHDSLSLNRFYTRLFKGDIVGLQTSDTVWQSMPSRYLLIMKLTYGTRVKTLDAQVLRRLTMEAEVWDVRAAEVVMRLAVIGSESQGRTPDAKFFHATMNALFRQLPGVRHVEHNEQW